MATDADIPHIKKAIQAAALCKQESGTPRPKVGVVATRDRKEVGVAYRGELKPGEHAEYTLLERKLKDAVLAGATLYTTLEPCTRRGKDKTPCADRIVQRRIRRVVIGMVDPDDEICGKGIRKLRSAGIEIDIFPAQFMAQVEEQNRTFTVFKEKQAALHNGHSSICLTLERIELESAPKYVYKFKLRTYWTNDGGEIHLGPPTWLPGGIDIQGAKIAHSYQVWANGNWQRETSLTAVAPQQKVRLWIGLNQDSKNVQIAQQLLAQGRLGTLAIPVTPKGSRLVNIQYRLKSQLLRHVAQQPVQTQLKRVK